jgi:hypothetical protein
MSEANGRQPRKIPRDEWSRIAEQHLSGRSLASIARNYRCTAPAIRYILQQHTLQQQNQLITRSGQQGEPFARPAQTSPDTLGRPAARSDRMKPIRFDPAFRDTMTVRVAAFLVAFDGVVANATPEALDELRDATDRLLRATAHVRIELERARDAGRRAVLETEPGAR